MLFLKPVPDIVLVALGTRPLCGEGEGNTGDRCLFLLRLKSGSLPVCSLSELVTESSVAEVVPEPEAGSGVCSFTGDMLLDLRTGVTALKPDTTPSLLRLRPVLDLASAGLEPRDCKGTRLGVADS